MGVARERQHNQPVPTPDLVADVTLSPWTAFGPKQPFGTTHKHLAASDFLCIRLMVQIRTFLQREPETSARALWFRNIRVNRHRPFRTHVLPPKHAAAACEQWPPVGGGLRHSGAGLDSGNNYEALGTRGPVASPRGPYIEAVAGVADTLRDPDCHWSLDSSVSRPPV